ncbi:hypothetical protein [Sphingobacterium sp. MYb382]|uniref:hypothetical protein n=1 Tax=Sphingobacterium sp. MYb382 TaxID=2745278 RepID=UPI0030B29234
MQKKTSLSSISNSLVGDMSNLHDDQSGSLMGGFAVLSTEHMANNLKGEYYNLIKNQLELGN